MYSALRRWFIAKPPEAVNATYIALVAAARNPFFYTDLKVPDTLDGRFDLNDVSTTAKKDGAAPQGGRP